MIIFEDGFLVVGVEKILLIILREEQGFNESTADDIKTKK